MGAKKAKRQHYSNNNVISFKQANKHVNILPRNKSQETYMLKLLDTSKNIVFGIDPRNVKTLIAVQMWLLRSLRKVMLTKLS